MSQPFVVVEGRSERRPLPPIVCSAGSERMRVKLNHTQGINQHRNMCKYVQMSESSFIIGKSMKHKVKSLRVPVHPCTMDCIALQHVRTLNPLGDLTEHKARLWSSARSTPSFVYQSMSLSTPRRRANCKDIKKGLGVECGGGNNPPLWSSSWPVTIMNLRLERRGNKLLSDELRNRARSRFYEL